MTRHGPVRVLIVEDSSDDAELLVLCLRQAGYEPIHERVASRAALRGALVRAPWDIVISDYEMAGFSGLQALAEVQAAARETPFIILSGKIEQETAVEAMRLGARDFIMKGDTARLAPVIKRELEEAAVRRERAVAARRSEELQKRLEAEKMVVQQLREIDAAKDQFVETVTHELRTPMAPLRSAIDLFLDGLVGPLTVKQREILEMMRRNVERLSHFATDILLLSRIQTGNQPLQTMRISLLESIVPVVALLQQRADQERKTLTVDIPPELTVYADSDALAQITTNLVTNAIVHTPEGTRITLASHRAGAVVQVSVSDTGAGMPEEALRKLFTPFFQANRKHGPGYRGMGLGLAICKGLVERMGGRISVDSAPGAGSTFAFTLPADGAADACEGRMPAEAVMASCQAQEANV